MSLSSIRTQLAAALASIDGLRASATITDQINPPMALIECDIVYDLTMARGADVYTFSVQVYAARDSERASQLFLDTLRDPASTTGVKQIVEGYAGLAAVCDYARVTKVSRVSVVEIAATQYLMTEFEVEIVF